MSRYLQVATVVIVALLVAGCGGPPRIPSVVVKGKLMKGGAPLTVPNMESKVGSVKVELYPVHSGADDTRSTTGTLGGTDGTFELTAKPGKYKLSIVADPGTAADQLGGKFSGDTSPIDVDIAEKNIGSTQDLGTLDLDTYK